MIVSRAISLIAATLALAVASGCAYTAPVIPGIGTLYSDTRAPLDNDFAATRVGSKVGRASVTSILGLFSFGDASAATAARNGNISTIHHADYEWFSVLGIYTSFTTVVQGE